MAYLPRRGTKSETCTGSSILRTRVMSPSNSRLFDRAIGADRKMVTETITKLRAGDYSAFGTIEGDREWARGHCRFTNTEWQSWKKGYQAFKRKLAQN